MQYYEHNNSKIIKYQKEYEKTGKHYSLARCYSVKYEINFNDKINSFKNAMYIKDINNRKKYLIFLIGIFFEKEIDYIFNNHRIYRKDSNSIELCKNELYKWMSCINIKKYNEFNLLLSKTLRENFRTSNLNKYQIKKIIILHIYSYLAYNFICL